VTLVSAYLDVDVVKTDYDEDSEYVEYIRINGIAWPGQGNATDGTCHPNGADMCFSYHKCMERYDVLQVANGNAMTVTVKVSNAVNDYCAPRLQARVSLYGSYRPKVPETATMVQNGKPLPLAGITTLKANGRTLVFKDLQFPVAGNGYRLRFSTDAGMVWTETEPFDVRERASKGIYIRQPGEAMAGEPLLRQPVVEYRDQFEGLVTTYAPWVEIFIGIAQNWDQTLADGFGGYRNLVGADKPVLYGLLEAQGQGGIVQFVNVTIDRPVERLSLTTRACLKGPTGLPESDCVVTESAAFAVLPSVSSLALANNSMPVKVKAGRMVSANVLLYNAGLLSGAATGGAVLSFSTSTVELNAVNSASGSSKITSRGKLAVSAAKGVAQFSEFYLDTVGVSAVTFQAKSRISGVVLASVLRNIVVEAGDAAAIVVLNKSLALNDGIDYAHLWAGKPFFVQLEIQDRFGNRNFSPNLSPVVRASQSSQVKLFTAQIGGTGNTATTSSASDLIQNKTVDGVVTFYLRLDAAKEVRLIFEVALSPAQEDCAADDIADASPPSCPGDSRGLQYCEQADTALGASACMALPLCAFNPVARRCAYACPCAGGVRERWCAACVANTSLSVKTYALASSGQIKLTMQRQPAQAVDGMVMKIQPRVLVEVCINAQCNPLASQTVYVSLKSARDETTLGGQSFNTTLMCPAGQPGGNCSATSDFNGIVSFYGIGLDSPGSDGASNVLLEFSRYPVAPILAEAFKLDAQENLAPVLVAPSPVLCEDDATPIVYYAVVGSRLHIVMNATDSNTAPYDRLTMEVACEAETLPGVSDCNKVMPVSAYLSENIYSWSSIVSKLYNPACHQVIPRSAKVRQIRQKDKVERHFVWSPVSWFPTLSLRYKSVEGLSGYDGRAQLSTCERTVQVVVCDRPRFVAPSPLGVEGHLMTLANTDIVFTVAALDRNQDDVVEIVTDQVLDSSAVQLGPNVYDEKLLVTGLEITSRNRVSRLVRWSVPNDGISHKLCFRARDNQFPCGDGGGLVSEDTLCVHCALEPLGVYTTCSSTLTAENLDLRLPPIICGDGRITDTEQCDDDNSLSGDGCSSLCTLEPGYHQVDPDPRPKYTCGDGLVVRGESCDDMNTQDSDGCSDTCQTEFGFTCLECGEKTECLPTCGDSILASNVHRNETCDNVAGCSSQCR
jgi:cysteine-rich repeat protein